MSLKKALVAGAISLAMGGLFGGIVSAQSSVMTTTPSPTPTEELQPSTTVSPSNDTNTNTNTNQRAPSRVPKTGFGTL